MPTDVDTALAAAAQVQDLTPSEQAIAVAIALAGAADSAVDARVAAWLAGRISRVDACYAVANSILTAIAKASLAGEFFAQQERNTRISPRVIPASEHERLTRAMDAITRDVQQDRATEVARALVEPEKTPQAPQTVPRAARLARAEVIKAGRTAYGSAVTQVIGADPEFVWQYSTDAHPCTRCISLARKTFKSFSDAPKEGAHIGCVCSISAVYREDG